MSEADLLSPEELETELLTIPEGEVREALDEHLRISIEELDRVYAERPADFGSRLKAVGRVGLFSFAKAVFEGDKRGDSMRPAWQTRAKEEISSYVEEDPDNRQHLLNTGFFARDPKIIRSINRIIFVGIDSRVRYLPESGRALAVEITLNPYGIFDPTAIEQSSN